MAVAIQPKGKALQSGPPVELFQTRIVYGGVGPSGWVRPQYAVMPDERFLMNVEELSDTPITLT